MAEGSAEAAADATLAATPHDLAPFIMEDALQRLRILNYEAAYCAPKDIAPFHKFQFAAAGPNPR
jgi:hypothetical protein